MLHKPVKIVLIEYADTLIAIKMQFDIAITLHVI